MSDYIPTGDAAKVVWLNNFTSWLITNGASHGFNSVDITAMTTATASAVTSLTDHETQRTAAIAATALKNTDIGAAIALARDNAKRIQSYPTTSDSDRGAAGITIPDLTATPTPVDKILGIVPPDVHLDFSIRQQITIHWGPTPQDERRNARPQGVMGCEVQFHRGGIPTNEDDWRPLDTDTASPLVHTVHESVPTTYAYRARYFGKKLKHGPAGDPAVCTVSV